MEIKRFTSILERVQYTKPKIGQYIFDKYLSDILNTSSLNISGIINPSIIDTPPYKSAPYANPYKIEYYFSIRQGIKNHNFNKEHLNLLLSIIDITEPLCSDTKAVNGASFYIEGKAICLQLLLNAKKIEEIKSSKEFQDWMISAELNYSKHKEELILKKDIKKYNL